LLEVRGLSKSYGTFVALHGIDLIVSRGERLAIIGPSGSGKSTLLRCLNLIIEPTGGALLFRNEIVGKWPRQRGEKPLSSGERARYRSHLAMVFQHFELFSHLNALENITLGPIHGLGLTRGVAESRAMALLDRMGLKSLAGSYPNQLSGGQQQRVAIARALAMEPEALLFDEPTSALDPELVGEVLEVMRRLAEERRTMVIVTHELGFVRDIADRVLVMERAQIIEDSPTEVIFSAPKNARTSQFLQAVLLRRPAAAVL
jgi:ABC-type polar amino acid transport system ATPase subunit